MTLLEKIDEYRALLDEKANLKDLTKENNENVEACRDELAQMMIDEDTPKISRDGYGYTVTSKAKYNKKACDDDDFFEFLEQEGLGDLIQRKVDARTLQSQISQIVSDNDDEMPEGYNEYINCYEYLDVSRRKETKKK